MAPRQLYFGTKDNMVPVPHPAFNANFSRVGWGVTAVTLQGGAYVRRSTASHKVYEMSWDLTSRDDIRPIMDFAEGVHGPGLIYFLDPFAMDKNVMPQAWGAPVQGCSDGLILFGKDRPALAQTPTNTNGYPGQSAQYTMTTDGSPLSVFIPNIPGHTIWIGAHGWSTGSAKVQVTAETMSTKTPLTILAPSSTTRCNTSFTDALGVSVSLSGTTGLLSLTSIIAQVLPNGATPATGGFISGQGHSGCRFAEEPSYSAYSAALDKVGLSATLIETGSTEAWASN